MIMNNGDMPAMPLEGFTVDYNGEFNGAPDIQLGLTKREMFAMNAMQGLCSIDVEMAKVLIQSSKGDNITAIISGLAVEYADALLKELDK